MEPKVFFFDVDNTLFVHEPYGMVESSLRALEALHKNGYKVVVCTSRTQDETIHLPQRLWNCLDGWIFGAGARVVQEHNLIEHHAMSEEVGQKLIAILNEADVTYRYNGQELGQFHLNREDGEISDLFYYLYRVRPTVQPYQNECLTNVLAYGLQNMPKMMEKIRKEIPEVELTPLKRTVEITPKGVDKGQAIARLCRKWNIDASEVVACGDGLNDVGMLKWAGLGVAMGNAFEEVKRAADVVIGEAHEDSIEQFCKERGWIK